MGLVTVALLPLTPLALRPVRLACLIHAANVHSEPGSNPSKSVVPTGPPRGRAHRHAPLPTGRGYLTGRTATACGRGEPRPRAPATHGWCYRPHRMRVPTETAAVPTPAHHAGFPQGFTQQICYWHDLRSTELSKKPPTPPAGATPPVSGGHAGRFAQFAVFVLTSGESYDNREITEVNTPIRIHSNFRNQGVAGAARNSGVAPRGTSIEQVANAPLDR